MSSQIPEPDWRQFKQVHQTLLERFCAGVLKELSAITTDPNGTPHERYLRAYKLLHKRDKELGRSFDDFRRSTAVMQLSVMRRMGLLTDEELSRFSAETQNTIRAFESISRDR